MPLAVSSDACGSNHLKKGGNSLNVYGKTDTGRIRESNQDSFICGRLTENTLFCVVCDGMGGANGGNVASSMAVKIISDRIIDVYREELADNSLKNMLESAIAAANINIYDTSMTDENLHGMGTTAVAAVVVDRKLHIVHVGDSRAYLVGQGEIKQITRDHSVVQAMVEKGQLTQNEARNHPRKHFITRALGVEDSVDCDYNRFIIDDKQNLLICTDGLTNLLEIDIIEKAVNEQEDKADVPQRLIHLANMAGGSDNITVVIVA